MATDFTSLSDEIRYYAFVTGYLGSIISFCTVNGEKFLTIEEWFAEDESWKFIGVNQFSESC